MAYQDCAKGAVSYPKSIKIIHQTVRNFQRYHVNDCPCIPSDVKERLRAYEKKKHQSKRDAKHYWVDSFRALGLCDVVMDETKREEIRFVDEDGHDHQASAEEREAIAARRVYVPPRLRCLRQSWRRPWPRWQRHLLLVKKWHEFSGGRGRRCCCCFDRQVSQARHQTETKQEG